MKRARLFSKDKRLLDDQLPLLPIRDDYRRKKVSRRRYVLYVLLALTCFGLFAYQVYAAEMPVDVAASQPIQPAGPDLEKIGAGEFWLSVLNKQSNEQGNEQADVQQIPAQLTQASEVEVKVSGMLAHVRMVQTFANPSDQWVEGRYLFPMPEQAAVYRYEMLIGDRRIRGIVKEKADARKIYETAKSEGKKASLLTQQRPNLFTTQVANVGPGESIRVEIEYVQTIGYSQGQFSLRIPTTFTPRYIARASAVDETGETEAREYKTHIEQQEGIATAAITLGGDGWAEDAWALNTPFSIASAGHNQLRLTAQIDMGLALSNVDSLYHGVSVNRKDSTYELALSAATEPMDRDVVLHWRPAPSALPQAAFFRERIDNEDYGLLMLVPPGAEQAQAKSIRKELIYIIDTSGSMGGASIRQAKQALKRSLARLKPDDRFNIIEFNTYTQSLYSTPMLASAANVAKAQRFVASLNASGGTEMMPALQMALKPTANPLQNDDGLLRQVVFMTDGAVSNEAALMRQVQSRLGDKRLFTVGIGSAPNSHFMRKIAEFGRGTFTYIGDVNEVETRIDELFRQLETPQLTDIKIAWPQATQVEHYPSKIPDLYAGEPLVLVAKADRFDGEIKLTGNLADRPWQQNIRLTAVDEAALSDSKTYPGVATRWARAKIDELLDQKVEGEDPQKIRHQVLDVALQHQLMSPYTSFVAVEEKVSRIPELPLTQAAVASTLPKGSTLTFPKTATGSMLQMLQGLVLMLLAAGVYWRALIIAYMARLGVSILNKRSKQ